MEAYGRSHHRRKPSGPLSRLLPSASDPLDAFGLPSKGETRLNDFKTQEGYYSKIVERYIKFCADSGNTDELEKQFASMSVVAYDDLKRDLGNGKPLAISQPEKSTKQGKLQKHQLGEIPNTTASPRSVQASSGSASQNAPQPSPELTKILHAMRKLRESIVATSRRDLFAQRSYLFIIRASILVRHVESYHPALLYLLSTIHMQTPLSHPELHEFVGYLILDLACRQGDLQAAFLTQLHFRFRDVKMQRILKALVHNDWIDFWRLNRAVDGHQRALMEPSVGHMRLHALKCLGRSYYSADKTFVESSADMEWHKLVTTCRVGWKLEGEKVTIRRPKA